ncbi:flavoredoxin [Variibacter gotjawalensis]|uniref:Flavoredoxin n=1 Tax=Variibacter gotjawalensis TaxID=1333996 RepID=A0A0S3PZV9_9BRAD|nr:flavin reductase family protein [Variibacter gotjawalensis]NIK47299.1 flavin reductase (DIM6/NTAB) family NADH-FMN oxidoreductase RutF [Variibacter gotjawalensis]RZS49198.1 flavin reductase (DIM6/NTAB) family NADH-FMN oxidoreductase RutF [Variibacter gotjawalensis]BAT61460.1 flavoredoxin [Variibacter gotjawalensis]
MSEGLSFDSAAMDMRDRYKLLIGLVIPRPIALVTTLSPNGVVNAAPFSFFNIFSEEPPLCILGLQSKPGGKLKDTSAYIRDEGSFVVNLVDESIVKQMNQCAVDFPPDVSEIDVAGFTLAKSEKIKVPYIAEAPAALECRHYMTIEINPQRRLALGEILHIHTREGIVDPKTLRVDIEKYRPVARLYGNFYASLGEPFTHVRQSYEEWLSDQKTKATA